ncbi:MAG: peptidoglycan-binding domain-containing protein [Mariprofundaceae bacterium]|nr:peptidoglycan-binding domain-containing protein [Mariprofundaceae bacterium]
MARPLKMFMRGKSVSVLQGLLRSMGYNVEDRVSMFGASTRDAVKAFQRQRSLKVTGQVDDALLQMMQQGQTASPARCKASVENHSVSGVASTVVNQAQLDALLRLLVRKGLLDEQELKDEMERVLPISVTQPPLV